MALTSVVGAVVSVAQREINADRTGRIKLRTPDTLQFEAIERLMMGGVFKCVVVFDVPVDIKMSVPGSNLLERRNRQGFCWNPNIVFWPGRTSDNSNIVQIGEFKIGGDGVLWGVIIDVNIQFFRRCIPSILDGRVKVNGINYIADNNDVGIDMVGKNERALNLVQVVRVDIICAIHGPQFKCGDRSVYSRHNSYDDCGCGRCMICGSETVAQRVGDSNFHPIPSCSHNSPLRRALFAFGCRFVAIAVLFLKWHIMRHR